VAGARRIAPYHRRDQPQSLWVRRTVPPAPSSTAEERGRHVARRERFTLLSALIILPLFLAGVSALVGATHLQYLLYPSLAAIGYELFIRDPRGWATTLRNAVLGPIVGAAIGVVAIALLPSGPLQVLAVTLVAILAMRLLRIVLAPALAVALLTLLAGTDSVTYLLSVAASSLALALVFRLWRRFLYLPRFGDMEPDQSE
jgi:hypothetical protein